MRKILLSVLFVLFVLPAFHAAAEVTVVPGAEAEKSYSELWKILENPPAGMDSGRIAECFRDVLNRLEKRNQPEEYDKLLHLVQTKYAENPDVLVMMANCRSSFPDYGYRIGEVFTRAGNRSGTGEMLSCREHDRVFMLKLFLSALKRAEKSSRNLPERFYGAFAGLLIPEPEESWKLQNLTDLQNALPDYQSRWKAEPRLPSPVNSDGSPIFYSVPSNFDLAKNDGERLRFLLAKAGKEGEQMLADFLCRQLDPSGNWRWVYRSYQSTKEGEEFLKSLSDGETLAYMANGFQRISLPDDQNYIAIYRKYGKYKVLGDLYVARRQFPRALREYQAALKASPKDKGLMEQIHQLKDNLCMLAPVKVQTAGREPELTLIYRNAMEAEVTVRSLDEKKILNTVLELLSKPQKEFSPGAFYGLPVPDLEKHFHGAVGEEKAKFSLKLDPERDHSDTEKKFRLPLKEAGAYLVTVSLKDGNTSQMVVWLTEYALTMTQTTDQPNRLLLNHAATGAPVPDRKIRLHFFRTVYAQKPEEIRKFGKVRIETKNLTLTTDADGSVVMPAMNMSLLWAVADVDGRMAVYTGGGYFSSERQGAGAIYDRTMAFLITDRPIYKPGNMVEFSGFLRRASYREKVSYRYPASVFVTVTAPFGKELYSAEMPLSQKTGAFAGRFHLPDDAALGGYWIAARTRKGGDYLGNIHFRVEEYKKPEYRVAVKLPSGAVRIGETISASVSADYYFGQPVADAEVSCSVYREKAEPYFPLTGPFDWLYGRGYLLSSSSFFWHFFPYYSERSLVLRTAGKLSAEGKFEFKIPTAGIKERFGADNYRYTVSAEVTDSSRRVVSAQESVMATASPFTLFVYPLCGFTRLDGTTTLRIAAVDPAGKELEGTGIVKLFRRGIQANGKFERVGECLKTIRFRSGENPSFRLNASGVYEAYVEFTSKEGAQESGSCTFRIAGDDGKENLFSDLPLELSTDRSTYRPGDTAELLISSNKPGSTVYLFTASGMKAYRLQGYSLVVPFRITAQDCPNIFVSALMIRDGVTSHVTKQLYIPPESRILNVDVSVPSGKVKPRSRVPLEIAVTGLDGKPVSGAFAMTVYDKALEGVAADNVPKINLFFWGWKRWFYASFFNAMDRSSPSYSQDPMRLFRLISVPVMRLRGILPENAAMAPSAANFRIFKSEAKRKVADSSLVFAEADKLEDGNVSGAGDGAVSVRSDFLDRAFWIGQRELGKEGKARLEIPVPDNLTTWVVKVWSLTPEAGVGQGSAEFVVSKDFIARLEMPRFLIAGDKTSVRAILHNYTAKEVSASLSLRGTTGILRCAGSSRNNCRIEPGKSVTVPFEITALKPGRAEVTLAALADGESDAVRLPLPVLVRGMEKSVPTAGHLENQKAVIRFTVPERIRKESVVQTVSFAPGAAVAMVDLLPYLAAEDSGNVFGVVNRFLPVLSAKYALEKIGIPFERAVRGRTVRDRLYADYLHGAERRPVFQAETFEKLVSGNLRMIEGMVNADGGWGWFSGYREHSYADTTAYVVDALLAAKKMGRNVDENRIRRGIDWLSAHAEKRFGEIRQGKSTVSNVDPLVLKTLAEAGKRHSGLEKFVFEQKRELSSYALVLYALALDKKSPYLAPVLAELEKMRKSDDSAGTAYLDIKPQWCFFWYGDDTATQAAYLRLLLRQNPEDPMAGKVARYLTTNIRNAPSRSSVRALGAAVESLAEYIRVTGEGDPDLNIMVRLDEGHVGSFRITKENLWNGEFRITIPAEMLPAGEHLMTISCAGRGSVFYNTMLTYFTLEEKIAPAGGEMRLERKYYELVPETETAETAGVGGRPQTLTHEKVKRIERKDLSTIRPGTIVEVELIADTKNDYDYVEFTDRLPAGFEYVKPVSGYLSWYPAIYAEFRETGPRFSQRELGRGKNSIRYRIRAQLDGIYQALPASGRGVYAPELKCNTGNAVWKIGTEQ